MTMVDFPELEYTARVVDATLHFSETKKWKDRQVKLPKCCKPARDDEHDKGQNTFSFPH